ncbi:MULTISPECIES: GntR family transcriptional regulator [unclassified Roseitalea]|uniref:GntR family transcriptional regulator n=1 Tax=unclassified Roseitalea TaxID=2639107 RepID=UPI00273D41BC|nr:MULTISPECIES: GntR family transcriptional regulator [unclassified Roseitalea]
MAEHLSQQAPDGGKARRVYLLLRDAIVNGAHLPGDSLPGELRLAESHGVSRVTIRRALDALAGDGLIERRPGSGTVVRAPREEPGPIAADFAKLMPQIVQMGQRTGARLLAFSYGAAPPQVARALQLAPDARVQHAVRLRLIGELPFSHLTTHVPEDIAQGFSEADLATTPMFRLFERSGVQVDHAKQSVSAVLAAPDVAEALDLAVGAPLIALTRVVYDVSGRGIEHLSALYRPDRFRLEMTLARVGEGAERHWEPVLMPERQADETE